MAKEEKQQSTVVKVAWVVPNDKFERFAELLKQIKELLNDKSKNNEQEDKEFVWTDELVIEFADRVKNKIYFAHPMSRYIGDFKKEKQPKRHFFYPAGTSEQSSSGDKEEECLMDKPCLSLNDLLSVWGECSLYYHKTSDYKTAPLFQSFKKVAESKIK